VIFSDTRLAENYVSHRVVGDASSVAAVETAAERLGGWIGEVRVTPRFRTPLERELTA